MKIRTGYVSNSSSSSFVVLEGQPLSLEELKHLIQSHFSHDEYGNLFFGFQESGQLCFDWEIEDYFGIDSKWNWLLLQAWEHEESWQRLSEFARSIDPNCVFPSKEYMEKICNDDFSAYIDHQSVYLENFEEPFEDILRFFNSSSYIHTDNDNHD